MAMIDAVIKTAVKKLKPSYELKDLQNQCLQAAVQGRDVLLNAPTGYGKSLIIQALPSVFEATSGRSGIVVVLTPLNIIQRDQLFQLFELGIPACRMDMRGEVHEMCLDGKNEIITDISAITSNRYKIIFAHPESLLSTANGNTLLDSSKFLEETKAIVIDELHKTVEWETFRKAFGLVPELQSFFTYIPIIGLSGTLSAEQLKRIPVELGMKEPVILRESPDRPNIYLQIKHKRSNTDVIGAYEDIYEPLCTALSNDPKTFPVTLLFMPLEYCSRAQKKCMQLFSHNEDTTIYDKDVFFATFCSRQDKEVLNEISNQLKKNASKNPIGILYFCHWNGV